MENNHIEITICKNCGKLFRKRTKVSKGRSIKYGIRGKNTVTCSKNCSRELYTKSSNKKKEIELNKDYNKKLDVLREYGIISKSKEEKDVS